MLMLMTMMMIMIMIAVTKHDLDCTGCKKGLILGTRRLKSEVTHTSLVKRTLLIVIITIIIITNHWSSEHFCWRQSFMGKGTKPMNDDGKVDHRKALGFGESHS